MKNMNNVQRVVGWNSTKNDNGTFTATVYSLDHNVADVVHARYTRKTRAQAVGAAKKAKMWIIANR